MYLNVQVGNGNYQEQIRAEAGHEYTYNLAANTSGNFQETRIYINGANHLSGIGNLAPMYPYAFDLRSLAHMKVLDLGTENAAYVNANFTALALPTADDNNNSLVPLLESINVKNCHSLGGTIELPYANNIRTIEARGTAITGVSLPDYTQIETLHLPNTVTAVSLYGARFLKDFKIYDNVGDVDYSGLYTLNIYDSDYSENFKEDPSDPLPVDWISIALEMLEKESLETNLQLLKLSSATIGDMSTLEPIAALKSGIEAAEGHVTLSGTINVTGAWSTVEINNYQNLWNLEFNTVPANEQVKCAITYKHSGYQSDSGWVDPVTIETRFVNENGIIPDIYSGTAVGSLPSRASTIASTYQFG